MDFDRAIATLNAALTEKQPKSFGGGWVAANAPSAYRFIRASVRTETGGIDWDAVTRRLDRPFQKRWIGRKGKCAAYEGRDETDRVLARHRLKLYVFVSAPDDDDKLALEAVSVALVRLAQRGNSSARREVAERIRDTVGEWVERDPLISCWRGYTDLLSIQIEGCIRRYRYSGSFVRYLYRTLECAGRGLRPLAALSLDAELPSGRRTLAERVVRDQETGVARIYGRG